MDYRKALNDLAQQLTFFSQTLHDQIGEMSSDERRRFARLDTEARAILATLRKDATGSSRECPGVSHGVDQLSEIAFHMIALILQVAERQSPHGIPSH